MAKIYKLLQGKMFRRDGTKFVKGDSVIPTESEYSANKHNLLYVGEVLDDSKIAAGAADTADVSANIPANTSSAVAVAVLIPEDIRRIRVKEALEYINTVISADELERMFLQECDNKPKARLGVLEALESRRLAIAPKPQDAVQSDISSSENVVSSE